MLKRTRIMKAGEEQQCSNSQPEGIEPSDPAGCRSSHAPLEVEIRTVSLIVSQTAS